MAKWIRKRPCPFCGSRNGFAVNSETGGYYCHTCKAKGLLKNVGFDVDANLKPIEMPRDPRFQKSEPPKLDPSKVWESLKIGVRGGYTDSYLESRGIHYASWNDLDLREGVITITYENGKTQHQKAFACYAFKDSHGVVKALNYVTYFGEKRTKRYMGPKSMGVAMLNNQNPVIIAEGLENALITRQAKFSNKYGLCVAGDAGNLIKYAKDHVAQLQNFEFILVEDSDPVGASAAHKFRTTFNVRRTIVTELFADALDIYQRGGV